MPIDEETLRQLTVLSGLVLTQESLQGAHQEVTRIAVRALPQADGATITTFHDGRPDASAASDEWARCLDEMQYVEHEGPCLDAARTGNTFRLRDLAQEQRWPAYVPRALAAGVRSVLSLPLAAEGRLIGALNLYSRSPDAFDAEAVSVGRSSPRTPAWPRRWRRRASVSGSWPTSCARPCSRAPPSSRPRGS